MIQEHKEGKSVTEISREYGVAEQTFYKWQQKYSDMKVSEVKKMKSLEEENTKLKRLVAELSLEKMKDIVSKHHKAGSEQITMYLHQDGVKINHKRVERLYSENKMQLKNQKKAIKNIL